MSERVVVGCCSLLGSGAPEEFSTIGELGFGTIMVLEESYTIEGDGMVEDNLFIVAGFILSVATGVGRLLMRILKHISFLSTIPYGP